MSSFEEIIELFTRNNYNLVYHDTIKQLFAKNHKEYYNIDLDDLKKKVRTPIIIDGRNIFDKKIVEKKGFIYRKVGEGSKKPN